MGRFAGGGVHGPCIAFALASVFGQTTASDPREFEAVSVKVNKLDDRIVTIRVGPGGRFDARGYTLVLLMQRAYGVMDWNVTGGPSWIRSDRFDVNAVAETGGRNLTEAQLRPMLAKLLAERFRLRIRETTREVAGYSLVTARGGAKVRLSPAGEAADRDAAFRFSREGLWGEGVSMADFARFVSGKTGVIGVDQTGLPGFYDFKAEWKEDPNAIDAREEFHALVFDAIESQLGLKFERRKVPVRTLVIEHVEHPTPN